MIVAQEILQAMGCARSPRRWWPAPAAGRTSSDYFQHLAQQIQGYLREQMPVWRGRYPGVEGLTVAVMGCVVNGPGESKQAHIGISLPGTGEVPVAPVYVDGQKTVTLKGENIAAEFQQIVTDYVIRRYGGRERVAGCAIPPSRTRDPAVTDASVSHKSIHKVEDHLRQIVKLLEKHRLVETMVDRDRASPAII